MHCLVFVGTANVTIRPRLVSEIIRHLPPQSIRPVHWRPDLPIRERRQELAGLLAETMGAPVFQFVTSIADDCCYVDLVSLVQELALSNPPVGSRKFEFVMPHESLAAAASWTERMRLITKSWPSKTTCISYSYVLPENDGLGDFIRFLLSLATAHPSRYKPLECLSTIRESVKSRQFITSAQWIPVPRIDSMPKLILENAIWERAFRARTGLPLRLVDVLDAYGVGQSEPQDRSSVEWYLRGKELWRHVLPAICAVAASTTGNAKAFIELLQFFSAHDAPCRSTLLAEVLDEAVVSIVEYEAWLERERDGLDHSAESIRDLRGYAQDLALRADHIGPFLPLIMMKGMELASDTQREELSGFVQEMRTRIAKTWQQKLRGFETAAQNRMFEDRQLLEGVWKDRLLSIVPETVQSEQREELWPIRDWSGVIRLLERSA